MNEDTHSSAPIVNLGVCAWCNHTVFSFYEDTHSHCEEAYDRGHAMSIDARIRSAYISSGWNCATCLVFNGEEKEPQNVCRSCGEPRKTLGLPLEGVMRRMRELEENLAKAQESGTAMHNRVTRLKEAIMRIRPGIEDRTWVAGVLDEVLKE